MPAEETFDFHHLVTDLTGVVGVRGFFEVALHVDERFGQLILLGEDDAEDVADLGNLAEFISFEGLAGALFGVFELLELEQGDAVVIPSLRVIVGVELEEGAGGLFELFPVIGGEVVLHEVEVRFDEAGVGFESLEEGGMGVVAFILGLLDTAEFVPGVGVEGVFGDGFADFGFSGGEFVLFGLFETLFEGFLGVLGGIGGGHGGGVTFDLAEALDEEGADIRVIEQAAAGELDGLGAEAGEGGAEFTSDEVAFGDPHSIVIDGGIAAKAAHAAEGVHA